MGKQNVSLLMVFVCRVWCVGLESVRVAGLDRGAALAMTGTWGGLVSNVASARNQSQKSFLVLFFKKERLA